MGPSGPAFWMWVGGYGWGGSEAVRGQPASASQDLLAVVSCLAFTVSQQCQACGLLSLTRGLPLV